MADFYTSKWGNNYSPQIRLTVSVANLNGGTARVTWILDYVTSGYAAYTNGIARKWTIAIDGQVRSGTYNINGVASTTRISSGTIDVARGTSTRNIAVSASFNFDVTWSGSYSGTRTASGSVGVERKVSYTVSFNANGGSGAPGSQTRWYGEVITLSSTRPTRYGYIFQGWAKSPTGAVEYQPGSAYGLDANTTLYAIWKAETYTISYDANGGSGAPGSQTKTYGQTLTLSSTKPTRTNYNFLGWATSSGASTAEYQAGGSYTNNAAVTLYAVWQLAYTPPRVTSVKSDRCNSAGTLTEEGTYVKVTFNWATDYNISAIYIRHKASSSSTWTTTTVSATGKIGSVTQVVGSNGISTEYMYNIQIEVRDSVGSSTVNQDVPAMSYVIDFKAGGKGVAIGKPATEDGIFDVNLDIRGRDGMPIGNHIHTGINNNDLNYALTAGIYFFVDSTKNQPLNLNTWGIVEVLVFSRDSPTYNNNNNNNNWIFQRYKTVIGHEFVRYRINGGEWSSWNEVMFESNFPYYLGKHFNNYFDSRLANTAATFKGEIGLPYGLKCRAYKIGRMITLNMSRQIVEWTGVKENGVASEKLPDWAKPMSETTYVLTRNAGTTIYNPTILHLRSDGSIAYTCSNGGQFVHTGTVTYMCSNAD